MSFSPFNITMNVGSQYLGDRRCQFTLWAPKLDQVSVRLVSPSERLVPLQKDDQGYWRGILEDVEPGALYYYQWNGDVDRPDPASHSQPQGVHGPSAVVDQAAFIWTDQAWRSRPLAEWVIYELHVGTFTPEGTFDAIIPRIPELLELGVTAIELMPVAQCPGDRNWGYDGVFLYGVQQSYGGPQGLKRLVDACHGLGMAVMMDVVYNHLGPEGNYLWGLGTYFTDRHKTPWGNAINYDDADSDGVRNYVVQNALYWLQTYHIDGLRLDAIQAIYDFGAKHILQELAQAAESLVQQGSYRRYLIAESDLNDPRIIRPIEQGGLGLDAHWSDDFHHALHALITGERQAYYADFGELEQLAKAYRNSYVYSWDYSNHRRRFHGGDPSDRPSQQFVICAQNHDQVGNRKQGNRLCALVSFEATKLVAAALLLAPYVPLLFMGEEYGEPNPFLYFIHHSDPELVAAVRQGRQMEFAGFDLDDDTPDPQAEDTFQRSKLQWDKRHEGRHRTLWLFYQTLLRLRREIPALAHLDRTQQEVTVLAAEQVLKLRRWYHDSEVFCLMNFNDQEVALETVLPPGTWKKVLDSAAQDWDGPASALPDIAPTQRDATVMQQAFTLKPHSVVLYAR